MCYHDTATPSDFFPSADGTLSLSLKTFGLAECKSIIHILETHIKYTASYTLIAVLSFAFYLLLKYLRLYI